MLSTFFLIFVQYSIFRQYKTRVSIRSLSFYFSFLHWKKAFLSFLTFIRLEDKS